MSRSVCLPPHTRARAFTRVHQTSLETKTVNVGDSSACTTTELTAVCLITGCLDFFNSLWTVIIFSQRHLVTANQTAKYHGIAFQMLDGNRPPTMASCQIRQCLVRSWQWQLTFQMLSLIRAYTSGKRFISNNQFMIVYLWCLCGQSCRLLSTFGFDIWLLEVLLCVVPIIKPAQRWIDTRCLSACSVVRCTTQSRPRSRRLRRKNSAKPVAAEKYLDQPISFHMPQNLYLSCTSVSLSTTTSDMYVQREFKACYLPITY